MEIHENVSLQDLNTFGVDQSGRYFVTVKRPQDLDDLLALSIELKLPILTLGGGSNLLFSKDYSGIVASIELSGLDFRETSEGKRLLTAAAGENWHKTLKQCISYGWQGLENLAYIPGSVGAAPIQNIGAYGLELSERFDSLKAFDLETGKTKIFSKQDCRFGYRDSYFKSQSPGRFIIVEVTLSLPQVSDWRLDYAGIREQLGDQEPTSARIAEIVTNIRKSKLPDPDKIGNAGSFFKNPLVENEFAKQLEQEYPDIAVYPHGKTESKLSAAWLIEQCGLKGLREGDAGVSEKHALVLVNHGKASGAEIMAMAARVQKNVKDKFRIQLEPEPKIV